MTPDKGVEAFYQHMLKSTPVLDEFERASLKLKVKELFTQHHQDLMSEVVSDISGKIEIEERILNNINTDENGIAAGFHRGRVDAFEEILTIIKSK